MWCNQISVYVHVSVWVYFSYRKIFSPKGNSGVQQLEKHHTSPICQQ